MTVRFPVIRHVAITGYGLFENPRSTGIEHTFDRGVHLVVGINGLGKTTFLNMLYRALTGPVDMSKDDTALSAAKHELVGWRVPKYFRARVRDEGRGASIVVRVGFGAREIVVGRSLRTLEVESLSLDGEPQVATQARYQDVACELSNAASFFDFFAILRFLTFFLEDRAELIWDQRSQFDMLRLLFYDRDVAKASADAYDAAQTADSNYRNRRVPVRDAERRLAAFDAAEQSGLFHELRATRVALNAARDRDREHVERLNDVRTEQEGARLRREKALLDLEEERRAFEREQQLHYAHVFPCMAETAEHVLLNLLGGGGCLVCGDRSAQAAVRFKEFIGRGQCPVCESMPEEQEEVVSSGEFNQRRLDRLASRVGAMRAGVAEQDLLLAAADVAVRELVDARQASFDRVQQMEARLLELQRQADPTVAELVSAPDGNELAFLRETVRKGTAELETLRADQTQAETTYKRIKEGQAAGLASRIARVKARFSDIAQFLLAETCRLGEAEILRTIGQEGERIGFPTFQVLMSSGVFTGTLSLRDGAASVSESQREFIDLAFRMALMEVAGEGGDSMLVLETPEASLDSLFVTEAGALFRRFAAGGSALGNVFIASTNLNNEGMVPALFGAVDPPPRDAAPGGLDVVPLDSPADRAELPPKVPVDDRRRRLVNLLELAAPNAALRRHGEYYGLKLADAVYKDVPQEERPDLNPWPAGTAGQEPAPAPGGAS